MKKTTWIIRIISLVAGLILLGACQQETLQVGKAQYQSKAGGVVTQYAARVSDTFAKARGISSQNSVRGAVSYPTTTSNMWCPAFNSYDWNDACPATGSWNPWGGQPYGGTYLNQQMEQEVQICIELIGNVPPTSVQNFYFMVGSLARCLDLVVSYRNPLMTFSYRNLDSQSQYNWGYMLNWHVPQTLDMFSTQQFQPMSTFMTYGTPYSY